MFSFLLGQNKEQVALNEYHTNVNNIQIDTAKSQLENSINHLIEKTDQQCIKALVDSLNNLSKLKIDGRHTLWLYGCELEVNYDNGKLINLNLIE